MPIPQAVYKWHRLVMVRFKRRAVGDPVLTQPDIDDRGSVDTDHAPVVGICEGDTISVRLSRELIEDAARLYATSSDKSIVTVAAPALGALPNATDMDIDLKGVLGDKKQPKKAKIQIRFGSNVGHIIAELNVWVFKTVDVDITPHVVTIKQAGSAGPGTTAIADVAAIMDLVRAIWRPCGVTFSVGATKNDTVTFANDGIVLDTPYDNVTKLQNTELSTLLGTNWIANTINAYFVNQIGTGNTLGYGFSRTSAATFKVANPGIILGDQTASSGRSGDIHYANDLAHEIGHFFQLWHPENQQPPNELEDTWSRRMLMHNFNLMWGHNPWPRNDGNGHAYAHRPLLDDVGYGANRRGCFVTMKHLAQKTTDGECPTARGTVNSDATPY